MHGLKAKFNNNPVFLEIKHRKLFIKNLDLSDISISLSDILSLKTKNENDLFFLMVITKNDKMILEFTNFNVRDLCKSLLLNSISDSGTYKEIDYDTSKFIISLSAPLLSIFSDMNCTVSQFYNHLMQSNFYDLRNKPTSLDRLITEQLRDTKNTDSNFLTRINNYSLLMINEDTVSKPLPSFSKEINFEPIYNVDTEEQVENCDLELEVEETCTDLKIDKKDLKKILEISKKIYRKEEIDEESKKFVEQYKQVKHIRRLIIDK